MTSVLDTRDPLVKATSRDASLREREQLTQFFHKIQEAAYDGQNGSAAYAFDRLSLIQAMAASAIHKLGNMSKVEPAVTIVEKLEARIEAMAQELDLRSN